MNNEKSRRQNSHYASMPVSIVEAVQSMTATIRCNSGGSLEILNFPQETPIVQQNETPRLHTFHQTGLLDSEASQHPEAAQVGIGQ